MQHLETVRRQKHWKQHYMAYTTHGIKYITSVHVSQGYDWSQLNKRGAELARWLEYHESLKGETERRNRRNRPTRNSENNNAPLSIESPQTDAFAVVFSVVAAGDTEEVVVTAADDTVDKRCILILMEGLFTILDVVLWLDTVHERNTNNTLIKWLNTKQLQHQNVVTLAKQSNTLSKWLEDSTRVETWEFKRFQATRLVNDSSACGPIQGIKPQLERVLSFRKKLTH